jgi:competence protein ComEC
MFPCALAFSAGALLPYLLPVLPAPWIAPILVTAAIAARRRMALLAAAASGLALATALVGARLDRDWRCARDREAVLLEGRVATPAVLREGRVDFELDVMRPDRFRARLSWYDAVAVPRPGERWRLSARLRCRRGLANPGAADRELDLLRQGIGATGYLLASPSPTRLDQGQFVNPVQRMRERVAAGIAAAVPAGPSAAVLQGLSVGLRGNLPDPLWDAFAATGIAHLVAISGLHVTACALLALWLLRGLRRLPGMARAPHRIGIEAFAVVGVTAAYTALAGAGAPALRTLAMVAFFAGLRLLRRRPRLHEALAGPPPC